jgi:uroporphyrinogen III methyltransferase/synthase
MAATGRGSQLIFWIVLLVIVIAALAAGYVMNQRFERALNAIGQRENQSDAALADVRTRSEQSLSVSRQTDNQIAALAGKLTDTQNQQQALQQLYQDLARNRDDWVMTDAEQTLSTANQQLQLTGNVQLALFALQNADAQLATSDGPQVLIIRRAIAGDIDKLKATPVLDLPGLALKLDQAISQIDTLPLAGDVPASAPENATSGSAASAPGAASSVAPAAPVLSVAYWEQWWHRVTQGLSNNASNLVQVRRIDRATADAMLVAPQQEMYLRENVKLRLLSARLSLLSRNGATLQSDLTAADDALARYFDPSAGATGRVRSTIADVAKAAQQVAVPTLDDSLQALRQYKSRG